MEKTVRKIAPSAPRIPKRKRVAAYARVSSDKDAMLHSLSAQVSYYSELIQKHNGWKYIGVYEDEALTGTRDNRAEFQKMLDDCRNGRIDMIITKSISRLARNTVTMLQTVRELKELNVDIWFEKEEIHSLSGDGELLLTILSSFAQEESLSVSENCKWRIRKQFQEGRSTNLKLLGYDYIDGDLIVIPEEAETVRMIFLDYLSGMGKQAIMKKLNDLGIKTKRGCVWHEHSVGIILSNEKYIGNMLLQKTYKNNHIEKKPRFNHGELPMYFVENSHEGIIDKPTFDAVQAEMQKRASRFVKKSKPDSIFTGLIHCCGCGMNYRRKIANAGSKYAKPIWMCQTFNLYGKESCPSKQIPEDILIALTAEVLGIPEFDEAVFKQQISEIRVPEPNTLIIVFNNGRITEKQWQNKSRRDSWSAESKQRAREKQLTYLERRNLPCPQDQ